MSKRKRAEKLIGKTIGGFVVEAVEIETPGRNSYMNDEILQIYRSNKVALCLKLRDNSSEEPYFCWKKVNSRVRYK